MYERLRLLDLPRPILDLGGGGRSDYADILARGGAVVTANLETTLAPSVLADASRGLPFRDSAFASVLSLNTLEHVRCEATALAEMVRVLRPEGTMHIMVPFLYRVHGHPGDFHRNTAAGWVAKLGEAGIPETHLTVEPLVWDPFSSAWAIADCAPLGRFWWRMRRFLRPLVLARPLLLGRVDRRERARADEITAEYALGYHLAARRPE